MAFSTRLIRHLTEQRSAILQGRLVSTLIPLGELLNLPYPELLRRQKQKLAKKDGNQHCRPLTHQLGKMRRKGGQMFLQMPGYCSPNGQLVKFMGAGQIHLGAFPPGTGRSSAANLWTFLSIVKRFAKFPIHPLSWSPD